MLWSIFLLVIPKQWQTLGMQQFIWRWDYGSLKRGSYTRKGKSTEEVTVGEKLSLQKRAAPDPVCKTSARMVPAMCEPDTSSASPPEEDSGSSHVACSASGSQRSQGWLSRGAELWLAGIQGVHYAMWTVRPQKAELIFREEVLAKEINSGLYIAYRFLEVLLFTKKVEFICGWKCWIFKGFMHAMEGEGVKRSI